MDSSLLVVIPAFNKEAVSGRTLDALLQIFPEASSLLQVVIPGSLPIQETRR
jgi:hypothetical protein